MAHRSLDVLRGAKVFGDLDSAVSTASELIGFSARRRRKGPLPLPIEQIAPEILARASGQPVALLFGPESTGLSNEEFARCHRVVSISTGPDFPSLNLAQAVLAAAYTLRLCVTKRKAASPPPIAPADEMESLFRQLKEVLVRIEFLKGAQAPVLFRDLRQILLRARPDSREVRILRGILRQVVWASGGSKNRL